MQCLADIVSDRHCTYTWRCTICLDKYIIMSALYCTKYCHTHLACQCFQKFISLIFFFYLNHLVWDSMFVLWTNYGICSLRYKWEITITWNQKVSLSSCNYPPFSGFFFPSSIYFLKAVQLCLNKKMIDCLYVPGMHTQEDELDFSQCKH